MLTTPNLCKFSSVNSRKRSIFALTPLETYAYAIGKSFSIRLSLPSSLEGISFRPHKYYEGEIAKDKTGEILLYRNGELIGKYVIKYYDWQPQQNWHMTTFFEKYQVDEIVFPAEFDFDNILLSLSPIKVVEAIKLDYFKQLLNDKREKLKEKELKDVRELLDETADFLIKEISQYQITMEDIKETFNNKYTNDELMKELLHKITIKLPMSK